MQPFSKVTSTQHQVLWRFASLRTRRDTEEVLIMLRWAVIFLVVALVAALLGFGGIAGAAAGIAKILFFVFLVLFVLALIFGRRVLSA
jgi:uncharacterized membrane protein YtjA (UPF0391 family)